MKHLLQSPANRLVIFATALALTTAAYGSDATLQPVAGADQERDVNGSSGGNDQGHTHGVHVVHLQFDYVDRPLILSLFLIAVVLIKIGQSSLFSCAR